MKETKVFNLETSTFEETGALIYLRDPGKGDLVTNQTGGLGCNHRFEYGQIVFIPLPLSFKDHFIDNYPYGGWCCIGNGGIFESDIPYLEKELSILRIKVDPNRLHKSEEAWIYCFRDNFPCVLTWDNSD